MTVERTSAGEENFFTTLHGLLGSRVEEMAELAARLTLQSGVAEDISLDADRVSLNVTELLRAVHLLPRMDDGSELAPLARRVRHDLLNVLNRILGYTQLLLEAEPEKLPASWPQELERILQLARECERAVQTRLTPPAEPARAALAVGPVEVTQVVTPGLLLVVDDEADNRATLSRALRALGHRVEEAADGQTALQLIQQRHIDLVLLDIRMPGMDGYEVLRRIRSDPRRLHLPVMMISGLDESAHTVHCIQAGAEDFLPKPVDHVLLRARVNSLLHRRQLRVRELEQFFPAEVAWQLIDQPELLQQGQETDISVLFCDIRNYSGISRRLGPAATIKWVSAVMEALTSCVIDSHGVVVDFAGDELFAMWGAPAKQPDHAVMACQTGLKLLGLREHLNREWKERIQAEIAFGVGINSGVAWVGNSGTKRKFKYGPSGDTVNLGSRVQGATKYLKAPLIISEETRKRIGDRFATRRLGKVRVVNLNEPVELYELAPPDLPGWEEMRRDHEQALALFEAGRLDEAARLLGAQIARQGAAGPPLALLARTIQGILDPERWQPVYELPGK